MLEEKDFIVLHGGLGSVPGSEEARGQGCICPGQIGDLDIWGRPNGFTVDNTCLIHGRVARKINLQTAREEWLTTELTLAEIENTRPPLEVISAIATIADQVLPGQHSNIMRSYENRRMAITGIVVARSPETIFIQEKEGTVLEFQLDEILIPNETPYVHLWAGGDAVTFLTTPDALARAWKNPADPEPNQEPTREEWYAQSPDHYLNYCNRNSMRVLAWSKTCVDRWGVPLPFVVAVIDNKQGSVYYEASGGPAGSDWMSEWPKHWHWQLIEPPEGVQ